MKLHDLNESRWEELTSLYGSSSSITLNFSFQQLVVKYDEAFLEKMREESLAALKIIKNANVGNDEVEDLYGATRGYSKDNHFDNHKEKIEQLAQSFNTLMRALLEEAKQQDMQVRIKALDELKKLGKKHGS